MRIRITIIILFIFITSIALTLSSGGTTRDRRAVHPSHIHMRGVSFTKTNAPPSSTSGDFTFEANVAIGSPPYDPQPCVGFLWGANMGAWPVTGEIISGPGIVIGTTVTTEYATVGSIYLCLSTRPTAVGDLVMLTATVPAPPAPPAPVVTPAPDLYAAWTRVAVCEEGGWIGASGSAYPDSLGIDAQNWYATAQELNVNPSDLSPNNQIAIDERLMADSGRPGWIPDQDGVCRSY